MNPVRWKLTGNVLLLVALVALAACSREPEPVPPRVVYDLVESFPLATVRQPTLTIDFGQGASRPHLVSGWFDGSYHYDKERGHVGTWSMGKAAELEFFVAQPEDLVVSFRCAPIREIAQPNWTLTLRVNGKDWQTLDLKPPMTEYRLELPASLLRQGENRLLIAHPDPGGAPVQASRDTRVLWDFMRFRAEPREAMPQPFARDDKNTIFIPFDTRIDFFFELPEHSVLKAQNVRSRGSSTGRLRVVWQEQEEGEGEVLTEDLSSIPGFRLPLTAAASRQGRLSFFSLSAGERSGASSAGMVFSVPEIRAEAAVAEAAAPATPVADRRFEGSARPNVIIYMVDTLRADHLGCYGYGKDTSPHLDRFARDGYLFENAQAQSPWTRASVASLFTGLWPQVHGANDDPDTLAEEATTLAESLKELGYTTAGITANGNAHGPWGFDQGFDYFKYLSHVRPDDPLANSDDVNKAVVAWLEEHSRNQPFFLFVHTIDPHAPYAPPEPHRSRFAGFVEDPKIGDIEANLVLDPQRETFTDEHLRKLWALYDAEIAANDASFGRFLDELESRDLYAGSLVVFLSDHGEEFNEHGGWTHGRTLHSEMLDVPLVVKLPHGDGGHRVRRVVQHVDLYPTILELAGGALPQSIQGRSLLPLLAPEEAAEWRDRAVAHVHLRGSVATSLINGPWKVIQRHGTEHDAFPELYHRERDRAEQSNLAPAQPTLANFLVATLKSEQASLGEGLEASAIDPQDLEEVAEELRALGYIQ